MIRHSVRTLSLAAVAACFAASMTTPALAQPSQTSPASLTGTAGAFDGALAVAGGPRSMKFAAERLKERKVNTGPTAPMASVNGEWTMKIVEAQLQLSMSLQQTGDKVTGKLVSDHLGTMTVDGTFLSGTLKFVSVGKDTGQEVRIEFTGKPQMSGALAGDLSSQMGAMTWSADRLHHSSQPRCSRH